MASAACIVKQSESTHGSSSVRQSRVSLHCGQHSLDLARGSLVHESLELLVGELDHITHFAGEAVAIERVGLSRFSSFELGSGQDCTLEPRRSNLDTLTTSLLRNRYP